METLTLSGAKLENFKLGSTQLNLFIFSKQPYDNVHNGPLQQKNIRQFWFSKIFIFRHTLLYSMFVSLFLFHQGTV